MALLEIIRVPDPRLSERSRPVEKEEFGAVLQERLDDMAETMYAAPGIGLAAVQVADLRRMLVADVGLEKDADGERIHELVQLVNPEIVDAARELITWEEGCLSVPGFWEDVKRPEWVEVRYKDALGAEQSRRFEGYPSVIVQHEMDHLDGIVLLDKVSRLKRGRYLARIRKEARRAEREGASLQ
ncbi:MAG: peptide deformylase [Myxococcota bacterium]|nr:peptide deformylase [Myxococcota bacterium]